MSVNGDKTVFVTGVTGNQGGAVARHLLKEGFRVKALVRDAASTKALRVKALGAEIVTGDLNNPDSYKQHLTGVYGAFSVQTFKHGIDKEIKQGIALADVARGNNVKHFVYASVIGADMNTGVPHWESKFRIEEHVKNLGIPYSIIRPNSLYENFLIPQVKSRIDKGKLASPVNRDVMQQFMAADDVGKLVTEMFLKPEKYIGTTITAGTEELTMQQVADIFSEVLKRKVEYQKLPKLIVRLFMGVDLYKMFNYVNTHDCRFVKDLDAFKQHHPGLMPLRSWIAEHFDANAK